MKSLSFKFCAKLRKKAYIIYCLASGVIAVQGLGVEHFDWPTSKQLEFLVVNGLIGTVVSELLWLCGCFYTSSLIATCAMALTIPLSIAADVFWKQKTYHPIFVMGAIPMFLSFFVIVMLTHYQDWDPLLETFRKVCCCCCSTATAGRGNRGGVSIGMSSSSADDEQEQQSLISEDQQENEDSSDNSSPIQLRLVSDNEQNSSTEQL